MGAREKSEWAQRKSQRTQKKPRRGEIFAARILIQGRLSDISSKCHAFSRLNRTNDYLAAFQLMKTDFNYS
jgi:hypothetical protein